MQHHQGPEGPIDEALKHLSEAERDRAEARGLRARAEALEARADAEERDAERDLEQASRHERDDRGHEGRHEHGLVDIVVNGREKQVPHGRIDYERVLELAFGPAATAVTHTVNWRRPDGSEGSLLPGGGVEVCEGMIFTATATNRA